MAKTVEIFRDPSAQQQMADAQRQQAFAQALMAHGQQGAPQDWNRMPVVPKYGAGHMAAQLASMLAGNYLGKKADAKIQSATQAEQAARQKAMQEAWGRVMNPGGNGGMIDESGAMGQDPGMVGPVRGPMPEKSYEQKLGDLMAALNAGVPKEIIDAQIKQLEPYTLASDNKRFVGNKEVANNAAPAKPLDELAKLQDDLNNGRIDLKGYLARREMLTTKSPGVTVNTGDKYDNKFNQELAGYDAKQIDEYRKNAEAGRAMVKTIDQLEKSNPTALEGGGAQTRAEVSRWLSGWTGVDVIDPKVLDSTDQFNAITSKMILDSLGGSLGAGVSNADVTFIKNTVPKLESSKEARQDLMNYLRDRASQNIDLYNRAREYGEKNNGLKGFESFPIAPTENKPKNQSITRNPDGSYTISD